MANRPNYCFTKDWRDLREGDRVILAWPDRGEVDTEYRELYRPNPGYPWLFVNIGGKEEYVVRNDGQFAYRTEVQVVAHQPKEGYYPEVGDKVLVRDPVYGTMSGTVDNVDSSSVSIIGPRLDSRHWIWVIDTDKIDQYVTKEA